MNYINNKEFSLAVVDYIKKVKEAENCDEPIPPVTNYIGKCFLDIAENLSRKRNFSNYTYREEMVMDAVENCLKAIQNYNIDATTRSGNPNAFSYFTKISWYAFLRRIEKEKKQSLIRSKYLAESGIETSISSEDAQNPNVISLLEQLKVYNEKFTTDKSPGLKKNITPKRKKFRTDSDITEIIK